MTDPNHSQFTPNSAYPPAPGQQPNMAPGQQPLYGHPTQTGVPEQKKKKPFYKRWWVWALAVVVVIGAIAGGSGDETPTAESPNQEQAANTGAESDKAAEQEAAQDSKEKEEAPAEEAAAEEEFDYGPALEKAILEGNGLDSFRDLSPETPAYWIGGLETITPGTVRANVSTEMYDEEKEDVARWVFNMGCAVDDDLGTDLDTVVVQDTSGVDKNFYANRMNPIVLCE